MPSSTSLGGYSRWEGLEPPSVVVVDDEPTVVEIFTQYLNLLGLRACGFTSPRPALDHLRKHSSQLLITDFMMPDINGLELVKAAKAARPRLKVLLVSGLNPQYWPLAQEETMRQVDAFLIKPMPMQTLLDCCKRLLAEAEAEEDD